MKKFGRINQSISLSSFLTIFSHVGVPPTLRIVKSLFYAEDRQIINPKRHKDTVDDIQLFTRTQTSNISLELTSDINHFLITFVSITLWIIKNSKFDSLIIGTREISYK